MAIVRGLPNGGFVVLWNRFAEATYFRVFDDNGRPKTTEILVAEYLPEGSQRVEPKAKGAQAALKPRFARPCNQLLWVSTTKEGTIDIFMNCYLLKPDKTSPFDFAQRFDSNGRSLTDKLTGLEMKELPSYKHALEQYVKDTAGRLDVSLRHDFQRSSKELLWCYSQYGKLVTAAETKPLTDDPRLRRFFTEYCKAFQRNCHITQKYQENAIEKCLRED